MPSGLREIRRRIRSVENTQKITTAMKMVAAAKLRRAEAQAESARPYAESIGEVLRAVAQRAGDARDPLLAAREVHKIGYVVVTADRGLCGPYNAAIVRHTIANIRESQKEAAILAVGRKGRDVLRRSRFPIIEEFINLGDKPDFVQASAIGEAAVRRFLAGDLDEVRLVYAHYVSAMSQRPTVEVLLPLKQPAEQGPEGGANYLFEPDAESVLKSLVPQYIESVIYRALLEGKASEHGARMTAMDAASKNSGDLIKELVLMLNRARQAAVTKEISEIVGGAEALK